MPSLVARTASKRQYDLHVYGLVTVVHALPSGMPHSGDRRHGGSSGARRMPTPPKSTSTNAAAYVSGAERDRRRRLRERELARQRREAKQARENDPVTSALLPASMHETPYDTRTTPEYKENADTTTPPASLSPLGEGIEDLSERKINADTAVRKILSGHDYRVGSPREEDGPPRPHDYRTLTGESFSDSDEPKTSCYQSARPPAKPMQHVSKNCVRGPTHLPEEDAPGMSDYAVALEAPLSVTLGDENGHREDSQEDHTKQRSPTPPPIVPRRTTRASPQTMQETGEPLHIHPPQSAPTWMNMPYYRGYVGQSGGLVRGIVRRI